LFFSVEFLAPFIFLTFLSNVERRRGKVNGVRSSVKKNRSNISKIASICLKQKSLLKIKSINIHKMIFDKDS